MFYVKNSSLGFEPEPSKNHTVDSDGDPDGDSDGDKSNTFESETLESEIWVQFIWVRDLGTDSNVGDVVLYVSTGHKLVWV